MSKKQYYALVLHSGSRESYFDFRKIAYKRCREWSDTILYSCVRTDTSQIVALRHRRMEQIARNHHLDDLCDADYDHRRLASTYFKLQKAVIEPVDFDDTLQYDFISRCGEGARMLRTATHYQTAHCDRCGATLLAGVEYLSLGNGAVCGLCLKEMAHTTISSYNIIPKEAREQFERDRLTHMVTESL